MAIEFLEDIRIDEASATPKAIEFGDDFLITNTTTLTQLNNLVDSGVTVIGVTDASSVLSYAITATPTTVTLAAGGVSKLSTNSSGIKIHSTGSATGVIQFYTDTTTSVTRYIGLEGPTGLAATFTYTLPLTEPTTGQVLSSTDAGVMSWEDAGGSGVTAVTGTPPIASSGGTTPAISIAAATTSAAGSMSGTDKLKLDGIDDGAVVFPTNQAVWAGAYASNGRYEMPYNNGWFRWDTSIISGDVSGTRDHGGSLPASPVWGDLWYVEFDQGSNCDSDNQYIVPTDGWYEMNVFVANYNADTSTDALEAKLIVAPGYKASSGGAWSQKKFCARTTTTLYGNQYDGAGGTCVFQADAGEYIVPLFYYFRSGTGSTQVQQITSSEYSHAAIRQIA